MRPAFSWRPDLSAAEAVREQARLRASVKSVRLARMRLQCVAGCDVAARGDLLVAAACVFSFPDLSLLETATATEPARFPYVPGLLSFRELPVLLAVLRRLRGRPQAILCDGHGRAHPRRFGLACHLGVLLDVPVVGCAKSRLCGRHGEPAARRGSHVTLRDRGEVIGTVLRTRDHIRPLFVSIGHRVTLPDAVWLVMQCSGGFRVPEPARQADLLARRAARDVTM